MSINWRERLVAAAVHFMVTLALTGAAAAVIFFVWFPGSLATMVGGTALFMIVVGCDAGLGPLISLVIYSSAKSRKQLIIDYSIVGAVQLAALLYGVYVVALSRPVFIAFDLDRLEVVTAIELSDDDLATGTAPQFRTRSWTGPRLISIARPTDREERNQLLFTEAGGQRAAFMPKYYRDFEPALEEVKAASQPLAKLVPVNKGESNKLASAIKATGMEPANIHWLLVRHRFGFGAALIDSASGRLIDYVAVEPR